MNRVARPSITRRSSVIPLALPVSLPGAAAQAGVVWQPRRRTTPAPARRRITPRALWIVSPAAGAALGTVSSPGMISYALAAGFVIVTAVIAIADPSAR
jgi:hypothetical protein